MNTSTMIKPLTVVALAGLLAGCTSPDGRPDYTASGALIGGASGAAIGAVADRRNPGAGALIGGAAGVIAGGLVGHSMDQQAAAQPLPAPPPVVVAPPQGQPLGIADIKAMAKAGVGDDIILGQINNTHSVYNLDANAIIDLKTAGVSEKVITYMMNTGTAASTTTVVTTEAPPPPPPPTEVVVAAPGPGYVWVGGDWSWSGVSWVWIGGHWAYPPHAHAVWVGPRWEHGPYGWHHEPGHWR